MHALDDYGVMHVKLYEDIATFGHIATSYAYPVTVDERYVMDPSPIPKFDNPKLDMSPALMLFGAGREKRLYAVPPFTWVASLTSRTTPSKSSAGRKLRLLRQPRVLPGRTDRRRPWRQALRLFRHRLLHAAACLPGRREDAQ